jgi:hypothetical protein
MIVDECWLNIGLSGRHEHVEKAHGARESGRLSFQIESKVIGPGA